MSIKQADKLPTRKFTVKWTGKYPNLCQGNWVITVDGKVLPYTDEEDFMSQHMNTRNHFQTWRFKRDYEVEWEDYQDGLECEAWWNSETGEMLENLLKTNGFNLTKEEKQILYEAISEKDWRGTSCGGCI